MEPAENGSERESQVFMKALLRDVRALEQMLIEGRFESGVRRIGAEQELFLVDAEWNPAPVNVEILAALADDRFTTELARYNMEFNLDPLLFADDCLSRMEGNILELLAMVRATGQDFGVQPVMTGILPTLRHSDLDLHNITPNPRYRALNDALTKLRGGSYEVSIQGIDELEVKHESVMFESANTSFQVHFQVGAEEFASLYNIAQAISPIVLSAATNSPLLLGKRLWRESRIALFQQAVDTRAKDHRLKDRSPRVSFGNRWVDDSVLEIFREDIARFRVLLTELPDTDPFALLEQGKVPDLKALRQHNGTVYRWNRPCYGITEGKPHLRIENRILPSGPTVVDEVANAAFWFGLMCGVSDLYPDIRRHLDFDTLRSDFFTAAKLGLDSQLTWVDGNAIPATELIRGTMLPLAREGLSSRGIAAGDIDRYLGVIEERVASKRTGAWWMLKSLSRFGEKVSQGEHLPALTAAIVNLQKKGDPVHLWPLAEAQASGISRLQFLRVEQFMRRDVHTVNEGDVIDLAANVMDWEGVRYIPVESDDNTLVGLISTSTLLRYFTRELLTGDKSSVTVGAIMRKNPITVTPETSTLAALGLMRKQKIGCLPVTDEGHLVGLITEGDFMRIAGDLIDEKLGAQGT